MKKLVLLLLVMMFFITQNAKANGTKPIFPSGPVLTSLYEQELNEILGYGMLNQKYRGRVKVDEGILVMHGIIDNDPTIMNEYIRGDLPYFSRDNIRNLFMDHLSFTAGLPLGQRLSNADAHRIVDQFTTRTVDHSFWTTQGYESLYIVKNGNGDLESWIPRRKDIHEETLYFYQGIPMFSLYCFNPILSTKPITSPSITNDDDAEPAPIDRYEERYDPRPDRDYRPMLDRRIPLDAGNNSNANNYVNIYLPEGYGNSGSNIPSEIKIKRGFDPAWISAGIDAINLGRELFGNRRYNNYPRYPTTPRYPDRHKYDYGYDPGYYPREPRYRHSNPPYHQSQQRRYNTGSLNHIPPGEYTLDRNGNIVRANLQPLNGGNYGRNYNQYAGMNNQFSGRNNQPLNRGGYY